MSCNEWKDSEIGRIPYKWDIYTVEELINMEILDKPLDGNHGSIHPTQKDFVQSGIPFIMASDIKDGHIDYDSCKFITEELSKTLKKGFAKEGDILLTHKATIGRTCLVEKLNVPYIVLTPQVTYYRVLNHKKLNNKFLRYYFEFYKFKELLNGWAQSGSTRAYIGITSQRKLPILLPTLEEQEKIANILSSLDDKIQLNNEMNKTLEEMAQSIFKRWFVDFEFPNEDGEPYKSSGGEMVDSELGMIPKGWEVKELSQLVNIITKSEKPFENEDILYEHFSIPALDSNKLPILEFGNSISSNKYKIDNDCILISKLNPNNKRIWNPYCNTSNSICSTEFIVYKAINNYPKSYIYEIINSDEFTKFLVANATGSTGSRQRVKPKDTLGYKIVLPTIDKIIEIDKILSPIHKNIQLNTQESNTILQIRNTLLPKLMSGEIKVN